MINLLTDQKEGEGWLKYRRGVEVITSVVLSIYVVAAAGLVGGTAWLVQRQGVVSATAVTLEGQIAQLTKVEAAVRLTAGRAGVVEEVLGKRKEVAGVVKMVWEAVPTGVELTQWSLNAGKLSIVGISPDPDNLELYAGKLKERLAGVVTKRLTKMSDGRWEAAISATEKGGEKNGI
ncbi:MAG: hypothetical protein AAB973_03125 [Patescibacteria group bacterium]